MVLQVRDRTGRFPERPHYKPEELDSECESIIVGYLKNLHGEARFPITTDDLTKLIERDADSLDLYADLTRLGTDVEGVTEFRPGQKPVVKIAAPLAEATNRENRLRTTLTHEYGHVRFHAYLWEIYSQSADLLSSKPRSDVEICKRDNLLSAPMSDWMEWQAGYACGALLMPVSFVRRIASPVRHAHNLFGPVPAEHAGGRALVQATMESFQVSREAAEVRLGQLGFIGAARADRSLFD